MMGYSKLSIDRMEKLENSKIIRLPDYLSRKESYVLIAKKI